jgi:hypothetical protein
MAQTCRIPFYDFGSVDGGNTTVVAILQQYITRFAATGSPNGRGLPYFPPAKITTWSDGAESGRGFCRAHAGRVWRCAVA